MQARRALERDLRQRARPAASFELHYQPHRRHRHAAARGCEALLRWRHPQRGLVSPDDFIPLAEETGLIVPLGELGAAPGLRRGRGLARRRSRVAVNLSPVAVPQPRPGRAVSSGAGRTGLAPQRLELEITESGAAEDTEATLAHADRLRALGVRIAMDDFGTGYSSLSYLRSFPFDKVKIDRSFVRDLGQSARRRRSCAP